VFVDLGQRQKADDVGRDSIGIEPRSKWRLSSGASIPEAAVLLVFGKRQMCESLSVQYFAQNHGLTLAEAQVLRALCGGDAPGEVAARQGVAMSTVRSQLGSIRAKTGAGSLRDLVHQVAVLPPVLSALRYR
jgi:DNA-binding CsgD family transcriptional regulator